MEENDFGVCEEIYKANEAAHFPSGYFSDFSACLRERQGLFIVITHNNEILGFGGIAIDENDRLAVASLMYGMVRPTHKKTGIGTVLLLARLALLPAAKKLSHATLSAAGGSETFYSRFGFRYAQTTLADDGDALLRTYVTQLWRSDRKLCRSALKKVEIDSALFDAQIPVRRR